MIVCLHNDTEIEALWDPTFVYRTVCVLYDWRPWVSSSYPLLYCRGSLSHLQQPAAAPALYQLVLTHYIHTLFSVCMYGVWMVSCVWPMHGYRRDVCCHGAGGSLVWCGQWMWCGAQDSTRGTSARLPEMKWTSNSFRAHTFLVESIYTVTCLAFPPLLSPLHPSSSCQELVREMVASDIELFKKNPIA